MIVVVPPSETKSGRTRGRRLDLTRLSFTELTEQRALVAKALAEASARPDAAALLGVSPTLQSEIARNTVLATAHSLPALECYSGVLYDALSYATLDSSARRRANSRIVVVSALYGAVRPTDAIVPYRLSMAVNLPGIGPLAYAWKPHLSPVLDAAAGPGIVVDCRSSTYAAAWAPNGDLTRRWVQVAVPGATHMAKHTRGLVTRTLCESAADPRTPQALARLLDTAYDVRLDQPTRRGGPWTLSVASW